MRLKENEVSAIKDAVKVFDPNAKIYLFGSRVDDSKRGGDIDLLLFSDKIGLSEKGKIRFMVWDKIGEQKIDLVVAKDKSDPFIQIALEKGIEL